MAPVNATDIIADPRVTSETATVNGRLYHYLLGVPTQEPKATVFLIHGFPDLAVGWRYQIPALLELGLRVVAPDMIGYGKTDAPTDIESYALKSIANDLKELAHHVGATQVILGGHDWGGAAVYRIALHEPELVTHIFSICTPYLPPTKDYHSPEDLAAKMPFFGYMVQLKSGVVEENIGPDNYAGFFNAILGSRTEDGKPGMHPAKGIDFQVVPELQPTRALAPDVLDFYVGEMRRNGLRGPLNWYRTSKTNFDNELHLSDPRLHIPVLYIAATKDFILKPELSAPMDKLIPDLTRGEVEASHWALWEKPDDVNRILADWFSQVVLKGKSVL